MTKDPNRYLDIVITIDYKQHTDEEIALISNYFTQLAIRLGYFSSTITTNPKV